MVMGATLAHQPCLMPRRVVLLQRGCSCTAGVRWGAERLNASRHADVYRIGARQASTATAAAVAGSKLAPDTASYQQVRQGVHTDLQACMESRKAAHWVERMHFMSTVALEVFPEESLHWRMAGPLLLPNELLHGDKAVRKAVAERQEEPSASRSVSSSSSSSARPAMGRLNFSASPLRAADRARCVQAICQAGTLDQPRLGMKARSALVALIHEDDHKWLSHSELADCLAAVLSVLSAKGGEEAMPYSSALLGLAEGIAGRLKKEASQVSSSDLHKIVTAMQRAKLDQLRPALRELRSVFNKRFNQWAESPSRDLASLPDLAGFISAADVRVRESDEFLELLLPGKLGTDMAAKLLPKVVQAGLAEQPDVPLTENMILVGLLMQTLRRGFQPSDLAPEDAASILQAVAVMQERGAGQHRAYCGELLRMLWKADLPSKTQCMSPAMAGKALQVYWWQHLYSMQESEDKHPLPRVPRRGEAAEMLKTKLVWPVLSRLGEMSLRDISACLSMLAPPLFPPDELTAADRTTLRDHVLAAFPMGKDSFAAVHQDSDEARKTSSWWEEIWTGELKSLDVHELLELACGLREADPWLSSATVAANRGADVVQEPWWVLEDILVELERRLSNAARLNESTIVQLRATSLIRVCRCGDLWQKHQVETLTKTLLSDPADLKDLAVMHYIALLQTMVAWRMPEDLLLKHAKSLLNDADAGTRHADPAVWSELLTIVAPTARPFSEGQRVAARVAEHLVPHLSELTPRALTALLTSLTRSAGAMRSAVAVSLELPDDQTRVAPMDYTVLAKASIAATDAVERAMMSTSEFQQIVAMFVALGKLGWYSEGAVKAFLRQINRTPQLEGHARAVVPITGAFVNLRVHHAPLLDKLVQWYIWSYTHLREKPLPKEEVDEALALGRHLSDLSFQSMAFLNILAENLDNPKATPAQRLMLLSLLARFAHFPSAFRTACAKIIKEEADDAELTSLSPDDLIEAFNIHLCAVFDGTAALKHWLTEDEAMRDFFQVHTSQKWYQRQDEERAAFLQSPVFLALREAIQDVGLDMRPSDLGEVYHVEFVSSDAKERLSSKSSSAPPLALVCIKSKELLRWYVPITAEALTSEEEQLTNRCGTFKLIFCSAVQKLRHLQAMGYRTIPIWMHEWKRLETRQQRAEYIRNAVNAPTHMAISPSQKVTDY